MLKVSIEQNPTTATLKIEGKIVGPWAIELGQNWRELWASTKREKLRLDICAVTFVDRKGAEVLREIVRATDAEILADSPLTQHFATRAQSDLALEPEENQHAEP